MNLQRIKEIHHMLSQEACHQLMLGLVMSHLDYVNAILKKPTTETFKNCKGYKIWLLKLYYARTSMRVPESLLELHWPPIHRHIQHKVLTLVYKCMNGLLPDYLINLLTIHLNGQSLRSNNIYQRLLIPQTKRKMHV